MKFLDNIRNEYYKQTNEQRRKKSAPSIDEFKATVLNNKFKKETGKIYNKIEAFILGKEWYSVIIILSTLLDKLITSGNEAFVDKDKNPMFITIWDYFNNTLGKDYLAFTPKEKTKENYIG